MKLSVKKLHKTSSLNNMSIFSYQFMLDGKITDLQNVEIESVSINFRHRVYHIAPEDIRKCFAKKTVYINVFNPPFVKWSPEGYCTFSFRYRIKGTAKFKRYFETVRYENRLLIEKKKKEAKKRGKKK